MNERSPGKGAIAFLAGDGHPDLAGAIASRAGCRLEPVSITAFADGETRVRIEGDVRDADTYLVQPTSTPTSERLMTLAMLADAARCAGAARITAVLPYFGYARQDVVSHPGEPRSAQLAARFLRAAGIDRAVVLELHSSALESAFEMPLVHLRADEVMLPWVRAWNLSDLTVVSPDAGGLKRAQRYAAGLGAPVAVVAKTRPAPDMAGVLHVLGDVRRRCCLIVDDMASTGGTLIGAAQALMQAGAREVHALFIHAVMAPGALQRLRASPVRHVLTTDSVAAAAGTGFEIASVAALLAAAVKRLAGRE